MKKLTLLLAIIILSCSSDDDRGCECNGRFNIFGQTGDGFTVDGVDCETGEPYLSNGVEGTYFVGCDD